MLDAIETKRIDRGDVSLLPYQGPVGAPGIPDMLMPIEIRKGAGCKRVVRYKTG